VTQLYPPEGGGAERHSQRLGVCLMREGDRVAVVTLCRAGQSSGWVKDAFGVPLRLVRRLRPGRPRDLLFAAATVWLLLTELRRYNCIHWTMTGLQVTFGLPVAHWLGIRNVVMFAGSGDASVLQTSLTGRSLIWMMRLWADRIVVLNPAMVEEIELLGLPRTRAIMFPCEVDGDRYAPPDGIRKAHLRQELVLPMDASIVLFVGRFVAPKGLQTLVEAFAAARIRWPKTLLVLVGDGPVMPSLRGRIAELGLDRSLVLPGFLDEAKVLDYLQAADIFALVSTSEGIPCALIEAMAVGLPCVVTAIPALTQVITNGVQGLWAEPSDAVSIAACLSSLLQDAARRAEMGKRARDFVLANYTIEVMASRYGKFFSELCQQST
jgi:glycosyltransferase involved in cell wall biosynthesis